MRNTTSTNTMAHRLASSFRNANQLMTRSPNFPVFRFDSSRARDGVRIKKIAIGAMRSYSDMNPLTTALTWSTSVCETRAAPMPDIRPPITRANRYFSNQLSTLVTRFELTALEPVREWEPLESDMDCSPLVWFIPSLLSFRPVLLHR